jgi:hypothetical protein
LAGATAGYAVLFRAGALNSLEAVNATREQISKAFDRVAPPTPGDARFLGETHMILVDLDCDVFVAGGGLAGVCAPISAARHGAGSRLGGNSSCEVKMHVVGADIHGSRAAGVKAG